MIVIVILSLVALTNAGNVEDVLVGHMQPLGNQIPPAVKIDEYNNDNMPTPEEFFNNYMLNSKAVIFRGAMKDTPAFKLWTDEYIRENYGDLEVRLEAKKEKYHVTPIGENHIGRDNLRHFVDNYHNDDSITYIVSELPQPMYKDHGVPAVLSACGPLKDSFVEIDIWWSGGDSVSIIHKDAFNQLNCLLNGTKHWKMFEYKYEKYLHKHWEPENQIGGFSDIDVEAVNLKQHPNITKVPWSNFTINAGDCLYLPKSYYHQVNSEGTHNLAVSILYGRFDGVETLDFSDCDKNTDYKSWRPLNEFEVDWEWSGKGDMTMGRTDLLQGHRVELVNMAKQFTENDISFTPDLLQEYGIQDPEKLKMVHAVFDLDKNGALSVEELQKATRKQMRAFSYVVEPNDPSNGYTMEYSFVSYDKVVQMLLKYMQAKPVLKRNVWLKLYTKQLLGTKNFANEIFTKLAGSEEINEVKRDKIDEQVIKKALENWITHFAEQYSRAKSVYQTNKRYGLLDEKEERRERKRQGDDDDEEGEEGGEEEQEEEEPEENEEAGDEERDAEEKDDSENIEMDELNDLLSDEPVKRAKSEL